MINRKINIIMTKQKYECSRRIDNAIFLIQIYPVLALACNDSDGCHKYPTRDQITFVDGSPFDG